MSVRFIHVFVGACFVVLAARAPAHAAEPHSKVTGLKVKLGSVGSFTDKSPLAETTINMLVDPQRPSWEWSGATLIVPACNVTLGGDLTVEWKYYEGHNTSALHWTLGSLGGAEMPLSYDHPNNGPGADVLADDNRDKTWHITMPVAKGTTPYLLKAWTSKKGERSAEKTILFMLKCDELPPAPAITLKPGTGQVLKAQQEKAKLDKIAGAPRIVTSQLEVRRLRLDVGLPDANAIEWYKGQPAQKELLFHEASGPGFERGGAQWGTTKTITVGGQSYQSRGIDSCSSVLKLKAYYVGVKNGSNVSYAGANDSDLRVGATGPSGTSNAIGKVGPVPVGTESNSAVNVASSGFVFFPSGAYAISTELLGPAASNTPANNTAQLNLTFKCKALSSETWN